MYITVNSIVLRLQNFRLLLFIDVISNVTVYNITLRYKELDYCRT